MVRGEAFAAMPCAADVRALASGNGAGAKTPCVAGVEGQNRSLRGHQPGTPSTGKWVQRLYKASLCAWVDAKRSQRGMRQPLTVQPEGL